MTIYTYSSRIGSKIPVPSGFKFTFNLIPLATLTAVEVFKSKVSEQVFTY